MPPPEPPGPPVFRMAGPEYTTALLEGAGFVEVRTELVPVHFPFPTAEEYLSIVSDTAGPLGLTLRELSRADLDKVRVDAVGALERFAAEAGYEVPGVALCAVAGT
jgi:hypothetical protein